MVGWNARVTVAVWASVVTGTCPAARTRGVRVVAQSPRAGVVGVLTPLEAAGQIARGDATPMTVGPRARGLAENPQRGHRSRQPALVGSGPLALGTSPPSSDVHCPAYIELLTTHVARVEVPDMDRDSRCCHARAERAVAGRRSSVATTTTTTTDVVDAVAKNTTACWKLVLHRRAAASTVTATRLGC